MATAAGAMHTPNSSPNTWKVTDPSSALAGQVIVRTR